MFVAVVAHQEVFPDSSLPQMSILLYGSRVGQIYYKEVCLMLENELLTNDNFTLHTMYTFQNMQMNFAKALPLW